jgi:predicted porin
MIKYTAEVGAIRGALQYSFDEQDSDPTKANPYNARTVGGYLRYSANGLSVGGAYQNYQLPHYSTLSKAKVDAWTIGASYRRDALYVNVGYGQNKLKGTPSALDNEVLKAMWSGDVNGGFLRGDATKREMYKVGFGYQITPQTNVGLHYYHAKQKGGSDVNNGKADFIVAVADYAFSKRTDAYFGIDHTKIKGGKEISLGNGARSRTGITAGIRHRF